ncbi:Synaptobrevin [Trichoplax sp. H2]|nr:Synaptobrevin [Trichoplax sp. H2]|eukprot:RDD42862.1 Synaptobrevin [Trichoplax sp. H2]
MSQGGYSSDNIQKLHEDVHEVTGLLKKNVDSAIQRGQQLDDIEDRAEQLNQSSREFSDKAVRLKRKLWWQNTKCTLCANSVSLYVTLLLTFRKMMIIIGIIVVVILTIIIVLATQPWKK